MIFQVALFENHLDEQLYIINAGDNSEMALVKLSKLFNHSDIKTTRKYLGLRQKELLETYDSLSF